MSVETGKYACVSIGPLYGNPYPDVILDSVGPPTAAKLIDCTRWSLERVVEEQEFHGASGGGYVAIIAGMGKVTGTIEGVVDDVFSIEEFLNPGQYISLALYNNFDRGHYLHATLLSLETSAEIETGAIRRWTATWGMRDGQPRFNIALPDHRGSPVTPP